MPYQQPFVCDLRRGCDEFAAIECAGVLPWIGFSSNSIVLRRLSFAHSFIPMAFRIHDSVVRGEIDNRTKGIVRGKIWLESRKDPIIRENILELMQRLRG